MAKSNIFILTILFLACHSKQVTASPNVPALFAFGDSTADTGNNNYITTKAKADHDPYGQDFPCQSPKGRFSNGKIFPDFISSQLGLKQTLPPFLNPNLQDNDILTGVSFASSGAGFDDSTSILNSSIPVSKQTDLFIRYITRLKAIVGEQRANEILNNAVVLVNAGSDDFLINFYGLGKRRLEFKEISLYQDFVLTRLQNFVKRLYGLGCRKMVIAGIPPLGCLPIQMTLHLEQPNNRQCVESQNNDSILYNQKLQKLLPEVEASLPGSKLAYNDGYDVLMNILEHPHKYGFEETKKGCCGTGLFELGPTCNALSQVCSNHSAFMFWDAVHGSDATYQLAAANVYDSVIKNWA